MSARTGAAHVVTTTRKYKDRVYRTHLLRRSYREGGSVKNETLGNLSHLPDDLVEIIRRSLQGETFVPLGQAFEITTLAYKPYPSGVVIHPIIDACLEIVKSGVLDAEEIERIELTVNPLAVKLTDIVSPSERISRLR